LRFIQYLMTLKSIVLFHIELLELLRNSIREVGIRFVDTL
jgi:hypothetical protein